MRTETAMSAAMKRAGFDAAETQLRGIIVDALKKHHNNLDRAMKTIERDVAGDADMVRVALRAFARDLLPDAGQMISDALVEYANGRQSQSDDSGRPPRATQNSGAASSSRGGEGLSGSADHRTLAHPVREPSPLARAASATVAKRVSVLDTFKIAGRAIGDWSIVAAGSEGPHMAFHGRVLIEARKAAEEQVSNIESWMTFREVLTAEQMQRVIQKAAEVSDAA